MRHDDDHKEENTSEALAEDAVPELLDDEDETDDEPLTPESDFEDRDF